MHNLSGTLVAIYLKSIAAVPDSLSNTAAGVFGKIATSPLAEVVANIKPLDLRLLELARVVAE